MTEARQLVFEEIKDRLWEASGKLYLELRADDPWDDSTIAEFDAEDVGFHPYYMYGAGMFSWPGLMDTDSAELGITWRCWSECPSSQLIRDTPWEGE